MDKISFEEIESLLCMVGRRDLLQEFRENVTLADDYKPIDMDESSSDSGDSCVTEAEYEVKIDEKGFQSLK